MKRFLGVVPVFFYGLISIHAQQNSPKPDSGVCQYLSHAFEQECIKMSGIMG
jgi:hypothetical protein